jgi:HEAT repeat protein
MGRTQRLEDQLSAVSALRAAPASPETRAALRKALASRYSPVVARAADFAGEFILSELEPDLVLAFGRCMVNPTKTDPGCGAKTAVVEALYRMEAYCADTYLAGIGHVQMEPVWGGREDTAAKLRGVSALGLVRINYPNVMLQLAQLLADPVADARISAARAIGYARLEAGVPLLRFKATVGDPHPQVICECFTALVQLDPEPSLTFVAGFLQHEDRAVQEAAAVALGESHQVQAFPFLEAAWEDAIDGEMRKALLVAIALLRQERALDFLIALAQEGGARGAEALSALGMYQGDERIWGRVQRALRERRWIE